MSLNEYLKSTGPALLHVPAERGVGKTTLRGAAIIWQGWQKGFGFSVDPMHPCGFPSSGTSSARGHGDNANLYAQEIDADRRSRVQEEIRKKNPDMYGMDTYRRDRQLHPGLGGRDGPG
jgi:anion-transporting  ArsA/GET3 family ATPase